ncbi:MAG: hypothetical protein HQM09_03205 [Candidatus Riflebacteria bacterium]|nr:hypothetical protein [Candidatus Riflebacteria bacterium]
MPLFRQIRYAMIVGMFLFCVSSLIGNQNRLPEWYRFSATLNGSPSIGTQSQLLATLSALIGDIHDIEVQLMLPTGWIASPSSARLDHIPVGEGHMFRFCLTPSGALPNGSIGCSFTAMSPKQAILEHCRTLGADGAEIARSTQALPEKSGGFTDVAFALFPEEGFYPLSSDMWLDYDDRLKTGEMQRGPSFYKDPLITTFQARTDIEMYERLKAKLASEPAFAKTLQETGIDLARKRADVCAGYYVVALEAFLKGSFSETESALNAFNAVESEIKDDRLGDLQTAAGNLRALTLWSKGDRKSAEAILRATFYQRRKAAVQRYVLRNLGLLSLERGDHVNARESFRLALDLKPSYALLSKEFSALKK